MADIIDINVNETVEEVTINVVDNVIQVNINKVTNVAGVPYVGATQDVNLGEFGLLTGNIEFDTTPTNAPTSAGSMVWNDTDGTIDLVLKGGNVTLQVGQEQLIRVVNKTATNINLLQSNYQAVRVTGAQGQRLKVDLAIATNDLLSAETIGLVTETINNNQEGFINTSGLVRGINTTGSLQGETWVDGDILYLSPTVAGRITKVKPAAPNHLVIIGYVIHTHITQGSIFVKVDNGYELDELHNVKITTPLNEQALVYNSATQIWENKTLATPTLQQVNEAGRTFTETVGDLTYVLDVFNGGVFKVKILNNVTGDLTEFRQDESENNLKGISVSNDSFASFSVADGFPKIIITTLSTGKTTDFAFSIPLSNSNIEMPSILTDGNYVLGLQSIPKTASFTAENGQNYTTNGTITVTDPTSVTNKGFIVHVIGGTSTIGGVGYTAGTLVYRYYNGSSWISTNMAGGGSSVWGGITGTLSDQTDLQTALNLKANLASPALTGTPTAPTQSANDNSTKIATTAYADAKVQNSLSASTSIAPSATVVNTAINDKLNKNKFIRQSLTNITGVTGQSVICSILIPANTYASGEGFEIIAALSKSATANSITYNFYHDTTLNGITNAINTGFAMTNVNRVTSFNRLLFIDGTTLRNSSIVALGVNTPYTNISSAGATTTFNPAVDNYITITGNPSAISETVGVNFVSIRPL